MHVADGDNRYCPVMKAAPLLTRSVVQTTTRREMRLSRSDAAEERRSTDTSPWEEADALGPSLLPS